MNALSASASMRNRLSSLAKGCQMSVSDDTMRWLFGSPDPALTPQQQFQQDFVGEKPDAAANRARRAFCTQHGLKAKQDKETGYWLFEAATGGK